MFRTYAVLVAIFAAAAALAAYVASRAAMEVEAETGNRAAAALTADGRGWARLEVDGTLLRLTGDARSEEDRAAARAAIASAAPWAAIADDAKAPQPVAPYRPVAALEVMRGVGDVVIVGASPGAEPLNALSARLAERAPRLSVTVMAREDAADADFEALAPLAADIASDLLHGRVQIGPDAVAVAGLAGSEAALERIETRLAALAGTSIDVESDVIAPPPDTEAFALRAAMDEAGGALIDCAAPDEAASARLLEEAAALFRETPDACRVGAGAPDENWVDAASAAMRAAASLPAGRISLVGRRARLTASPPTRFRVLEDARDALGAALPDGYRLAVLAAPAALAAVEDEGARPRRTGATRLVYDGASLTLRGGAPSPALAAAVEAFARARLARVSIDNELETTGGFDAASWRSAATGALSLLARLERGAVQIDGESLSIEGTVGAVEDIGALHALAVAVAGDERSAVTRLRVPVAVRAAAAPAPVSRCVAALNGIVAETPVTFSPGSTEIGADNADVIAALAAAFAPCRSGRVEIGGHTDSQGSARLNLGLSRARAFAVLDALVDAGVAPLRLSARGYGEERPIADNGTEAGRAANRRIEFTVLDENEEG
ncbi:MAG: OmpA family protein [Pseudomonadota bacterium]